MSKYTIVNGSFIELPEDELAHWKYLRREKVGNKWRYYYKEDDAKLNVDRVKKNKFTVSSTLTGRNDVYNVTSKKYGKKKVDEETYNKTKSGLNLYIGDKKLKDVAKEQISMGTSFVKDLLSGNVLGKSKKDKEYEKKVKKAEEKKKEAAEELKKEVDYEHKMQWTADEDLPLRDSVRRGYKRAYTQYQEASRDYADAVSGKTSERNKGGQVDKSKQHYLADYSIREQHLDRSTDRSDKVKTKADNKANETRSFLNTPYISNVGSSDTARKRITEKSKIKTLSPTNISEEYLEELLYNSKKNKYR